MTHLAPFTTQRLVLTGPRSTTSRTCTGCFLTLTSGSISPRCFTPPLTARRPGSKDNRAAGTATVSARGSPTSGARGILQPSSVTAASTGGGPVWNLGFRLARDCWGRGYAKEIATAALAAAEQVAADRPVTAYLLEHNVNSKRATEALGLTRVWRGPDAGNPDPRAVRLIYADRPLDAATLTHVMSSA